ncbi:MAG: carbohydrate kinase family protein [Acidobacteriota bacterium]
MTLSPLAIPRGGQVLVAGSLAFDQIMVFDGQFKDHILPEKLHVINISFLVTDMQRQRGGCAGNIGYTLALLGERPRLIAAAGNDFSGYRTWLEEQGCDVDAIAVHDDVTTASCFITADHDDNTITGFFPGAMARAGDLSLRERAGDHAAIAIVAPDDPAAMLRHCREARDAGLPFVFDPSFQVTNMTGPDLADAARGAALMALNDYEYAVFKQKTGRDDAGVFELVERVAVTLGAEGSKIADRDGGELVIPAARVDAFVEPTGAGDAWRGGLLAGLARGYDLATSGRIGSVAAAYAVEHKGPQQHSYTQDEFAARYRDNFGELPSRSGGGDR